MGKVKRLVGRVVRAMTPSRELVTLAAHEVVDNVGLVKGDKMPKKTPKQTVKKAHRIGRAIRRSGSGVDNPFAVGMAQAKKSAAKRKAKAKR